MKEQTIELNAVAQEVLNEAKRLGAEQVEVSIDSSKGFSVNARAGDVETIEYNQDKAIDITVYFSHRSGSASITDARSESIHEAVKAACYIAKFTDNDPATGLPDQKDLNFQIPKIELSFPWRMTVENAIQLACQCEKEARAYDPRIKSVEESRVSTTEAITLYANSLGFMGTYPATYHEISCVLIAKDNDKMERDYYYSICSDPKDLESVTNVANQAAERSIRRLNARQIRTTKAPVIFIAEEARGLIGLFATAIQGAHLYRQSSFLLNQLDQKIFPSFMHIQEQPHLARGLGSAPFDDNGIITRPNVFVEEGILRSYALGVYSARKLGMRTTGNAGGVHNLIVQTGQKDLNALIKSMDKGFVITELMGQGINLVTGDYSRGANGFWVEHGEIQYPVNEVTVAGKLQDIYQHIAEIGNDVDYRGNVRTGSILISEMMIAGS